MKATRLVAGLVVVALLATVLFAALQLVGNDSDGPLVGGADSQAPAPTPSAQPGSTDPPTPELAEFYSQQLEWSPCRDGFECSTLTVPVDYQDPSGDTIELALLKDPADHPDDRVGSLVVNPGGPGAPGTSYAENSSFAFRDVIRERFDIIGFDPRGTGDSDPVDCLSDSDLDAYVARDPDPDSPEEGQEFEQGNRALLQGCVANSDALVGHVSTVEAARDMDVLRAALGESQLTYFGASYGTKLGSTYADLFPDKVGRLVLDGAVDPSIGSRQLNVEQAAGFEVALRSYVQACVDQGDCFLGDSLDEGLGTIQGLIADVDEQSLPTSLGGRELAVGNAFYGLVAPLYNRDYWPLLDQALQQALDGDGTTLLRLSDLYSSRADDGTYTDNSAEAILAINCLDDPYSIPADQVPDQIPEFEKASPTFGRVFAWSLTNCEGVHTRASEPVPVVDAPGAAPIVVVGTTRDPATPYQWAVHLADQLQSGVLITRDGDGHTGYNAGNDCVDEAVEDYLIDGTVPPDGLDC
ncbi:MAG TPA: alpha/beta hydrolase [Nocardioides sp.]|uniref:alpha/beta hydrolase n=1 Tax=uncultured Nocardioides sp. TaxID=198441 RepID=UPI00262FB047|nr:alpha/beta hydrolase [uncultured Nocardioides sp.]HRD60386.1 alpha/beta hydrolase [Nocardioides sp.]HRI97785.1 alpha/beta hydrolase [Nocardioides sp.]HRK46896.1 alpha/beta hydrolase [Nocardioides sp.]